MSETLSFGLEWASCPCGVRFERSQVEPKERRCAICATERELGMAVIHLCPPEGSGLMPCCNRAPFEVSGMDQVTLDRSLVTCRRLTKESER